MTTRNLTRRRLLANSGCGLAALAASPALRAVLAAVADGPVEPKFKIGACDWSIGQRQKPAAFEVAKQIGLDGVEVSFGEPGGEYDLREPSVRKEYEALSRRHGVEIASLAMGVLNQIPFVSDPRTQQWVADVVETMPKLNVKICLVAFFGAGDIKDDREKQDEAIRRLKKLAPQAERAGVVLGVESWLNAADHIRIVDSVNSPAVKVYYDVANMLKQGYDLYREIRQLGKERICQFHMKEDASLLGRGAIDFRRVKEAIDEIGYTGWLIIEGATVQGRSVADCYRDNQKYLRSVFPTRATTA